MNVPLLCTADAVEAFDRWDPLARRAAGPAYGEIVLYVADRYLEKRPTEKLRWEEYVEARREANSLERMFTRALTDKAMEPSEVAG